MLSLRCVILAALASLPPGALGQSLSQAELDQIAEAMEVIQRDYLDPVEARDLVRGCRQVPPESLARFGLRLGEFPLPDESLRPIDQIRRMLDEVARGHPASAGLLADLCKEGMAKSLDGTSVYLSADQMKVLKIRQPVPNRGLVGVGLKMRNLRVAIASAYDGTPAKSAGLQADDVILRIDGFDTHGAPFSEVLGRLSGPPGSVVRLTIERDGRTLHKEIELAVIPTPRSVWVSRLPGALVHLRVRASYSDTLKAFAAELNHALQQGDAGGVILDLRGHRGGMVEVSVAVASAFLPPSAVVMETKGRAADSASRIYARTDTYFRAEYRQYLESLPWTLKSVPLAVLVDRETGAGGETVAAALQDHQRAKIFGERTAGVGKMKTYRHLAGGGALNLTTAMVYRPGGAPIERRGIVPDVLVDRVAVSGGDDRALAAAVEALKASSPR